MCQPSAHLMYTQVCTQSSRVYSILILESIIGGEYYSILVLKSIIELSITQLLYLSLLLESSYKCYSITLLKSIIGVEYYLILILDLTGGLITISWYPTQSTTFHDLFQSHFLEKGKFCSLGSTLHGSPCKITMRCR